MGRSFTRWAVATPHKVGGNLILMTDARCLMLDAKLTAPDGFEGLLMRTTLALDDDVLRASKGLAAQQHKTLGQVVSELLRQSLGWGNMPRWMVACAHRFDRPHAQSARESASVVCKCQKASLGHLSFDTERGAAHRGTPKVFQQPRITRRREPGAGEPVRAKAACVLA